MILNQVPTSPQLSKNLKRQAVDTMFDLKTFVVPFWIIDRASEYRERLSTIQKGTASIKRLKGFQSSHVLYEPINYIHVQSCGRQTMRELIVNFSSNFKFITG